MPPAPLAHGWARPAQDGVAELLAETLNLAGGAGLVASPLEQPLRS